LQPDATALISDVSPIFKLHLFLGMTIFVAFPFTRLVHMWSAPVWCLGRTGYQVVRTKRGMARRPTQVAAAAIGRGRQPVGGCARPNPAVGTANGATRSSPFRDAASGRGWSRRRTGHCALRPSQRWSTAALPQPHPSGISFAMICGLRLACRTARAVARGGACLLAIGLLLRLSRP